ncbi:MAG: hypothetical protein JXQ27_09930 [Acidobacteria bacterium]|nr:hypothetical protein [Acidobacteriota bacterium]
MADTKMQGIAEYEKGLELMFQAKFKEAQKRFQKLIADETVDPALAAKAAENSRICEKKTRRDDFEAATFDEAADLAVFHFHRNDVTEAEKNLKKMQELDPKNAFCFFFEALLENRRGNQEKALDALARAIKADPVNRIRAHNDIDLRSLRETPRFKEMVETDK